jgi:ribosomal protein S18 acetylase RimI-like enzyme
MTLLNDAIALAAQAHAGQVDKAGAPYILHPLRVMLAQETDEARIAAVLHDVVEDTGWTLAALAERGFPPAALAAVDALTRRAGESYDEFVVRAGADHIARRVKLADLCDNLDLRRLPNPGETGWARLARYRRAWWALTAGEPPEVAGLTWEPRPCSNDFSRSSPALASGEERTTKVVTTWTDQERTTKVVTTWTERLAAHDAQGNLAAWARVTYNAGLAHEVRAHLSGEVRPLWRRRGLGAYLLLWAEMRARQTLPALSAGRPGVLRIDVSDPPTDAVALYERHGFRLTVAEDELRRDLAGDIAAGELPPGFGLLPWSAASAPLFYRVYADAFRTRPGFPGWTEEVWRRAFAGDDGFRPDLSILLCEDSEPVGYALLAVEEGVGWVSQMGIRPAWRRRGLGQALLTRALHGLRAAGLPEAHLDVNVNNPEARALYGKLGFVLYRRQTSFRQSM